MVKPLYSTVTVGNLGYCTRKLPGWYYLFLTLSFSANGKNLRRRISRHHQKDLDWTRRKILRARKCRMENLPTQDLWSRSSQIRVHVRNSRWWRRTSLAFKLKLVHSSHIFYFDTWNFCFLSNNSLHWSKIIFCVVTVTTTQQYLVQRSRQQQQPRWGAKINRFGWRPSRRSWWCSPPFWRRNRRRLALLLVRWFDPQSNLES